MKNFILNLFLFASPIMGLTLIEAFLPSTLFTFRTWEGISFTPKIPHLAPFYPNSTTNMKASGDLCHHTDNAIMKSESWVTDRLGFRNDAFVNKADILFIGDSFFAGSSLGQSETISNKVKSNFKTNISVYNMSPGSFFHFDHYLKNNIIEKPDFIIYSIVERDVPMPFSPKKESLAHKLIYRMLSYSNITMYFDKALKFSSVNWLKSRANNLKGTGIPSPIDSSMFFFKGSNHKHNENDLSTTVANIKTYKTYCDSLDINFIFIPMPDKESVYFELVPFENQPNYLFQLDSLLRLEGISTINTLQIYNDYRKTNKHLLYHLDDTHWNSNATELISNEIVKLVNRSRSGPDR